MPLYQNPNSFMFQGNVLDHYKKMPAPTVIISDGPYGLDGFDGDAKSPSSLVKIYRPHVKWWTKKATPETTLWFWSTEIGWATVHPLLEKHGWVYKSLNVWDKGIKHVAGNCNGKTMRKFPVVTEVCAHYVRKEQITSAQGLDMTLQDWLRYEWFRTGLPLKEANDACGVKNAASRKYLASDDLWYFPPVDEFVKMATYANTHGNKEGLPYFSTDGTSPLTAAQWTKMRAQFNFEYGVTNVWQCPSLKTKERLKDGTVIFHPNQKPLELMTRLIEASSSKNDWVWEPFGGTGSACLAAKSADRKYVYCEILPNYFEAAVKRLA